MPIHEDQIEFYSCPLCGRGIGNDIDGVDTPEEHDCPVEREMREEEKNNLPVNL